MSRQQASAVTGAILVFLSQTIGWSNFPEVNMFEGLSIGAGFNSPARAQLPPTSEAGINYTPPNRSAPTSTASGGARMFSSDAPETLRSPVAPSAPINGTSNTTLRGSSPGREIRSAPAECSQIVPVFLVPQDHAGETVSPRPKFFWYMSEAAPVEFALKKLGAAEPLYTERLQLPKPGIIHREIPKERPELSVGQDYVWSVSVACNSGQGSKTVTVQAGIRRVAATSELNRRLRVARTERDRARVYAGQGFWYDALETLSTASDRKPDDRSISNDFYSLLDRVGLSEVSAKQRRNSQI